VPSTPSALIVSLAVRAFFPVLFSIVTTISDTSELAALIEGVGLHHCWSLSIVQGVLELMLNTTLLGEVAKAV
jgi:hypothetical protein